MFGVPSISSDLIIALWARLRKRGVGERTLWALIHELLLDVIAVDRVCAVRAYVDVGEDRPEAAVRSIRRLRR